MNKSELINNLTNYLSIAESDKLLFLELFFKRISEVLKIGQSLYIEGFGYFNLVNGNIKDEYLIESDNENYKNNFNVIVFLGEDELNEFSSAGIVFNTPIIDNDVYHSVDFAFRLSIGKQVIPLRGIPFDSIKIPAYGNENKKFLESAVERIISKSSLSKKNDELLELVIDENIFNESPVQLRWIKKNEQAEAINTNTNRTIAKTDSYLNKYQKRANDLVNTKWEFMEDVPDQLAKTLDTPIYKENENIITAEEEVENIIDKVSNEEKPVHKNIVSDEDEFIIEEIYYEDAQDKLIKSKYDYTKNQESLDEEIIIFEPDELKDGIIKENKTISEQQLSAQYHIPVVETINESENILSKINEEKEQDIPKIFENESVNKVEDIISNTLSKQSDDLENNDVDNKSSDCIKENIVESESIVSPKNKKRKLVLISAFILLLLIVAVVVYWYLEIYTKNIVQIEPKEIVLNLNNANIIKRDFGIPISYPYLVKDSVIKYKDTINTTFEEKQVIKKMTEDVKVEKQKIELPMKKDIQINKLPAEQLVDAGNYIYKRGEVFVVQVASFKSKSVAESEVAKYRNKGYKSFVEETSLNNRGLWYRVKVGNFSSLNEAKKFIEKK
jgi:cell division septation protein DedD/nucleoid DNA-binding protein